jgi:hypothetical protein
MTSIRDNAFDWLCKPDKGLNYRHLRADDVDVLPSSGHIDPLLSIPRDTAALLQQPELMFGSKLKRVPRFRQSRESHVGDLTTLTLRMLRAGRLGLVVRAQATADTFCISKRDGTRLREIWSGGAITRAAKRPLLPPSQCTPSALANLEASTDRPALMSSRDGKVFFDQLRVPRSFAACLGRPAVLLRDLLNPPACESGAATAPPLTTEELNDMFLDGPIVDDTIWITPVNLT